MVSNEELIRRIEALAQERGVSKANALKESGVGKDFIANMKKGQKPALDKTVMIASYFGVSVDALLNGENAIASEKNVGVNNKCEATGNTFYERLDHECKKKGTTPTALLKSLNISTSKLTAWKKGSVPGSEWVVLISESLGVSIEYLLTGKGNSATSESEKTENSSSNSFWQKFERLCFGKGLTPSAVCKEIGLSNATASYWKQGQAPSRRNIVAVAKYFNIDPDELLAPKNDLSEREYKKIWPPEPLLKEYSWEHEGDSPIVKKYNAVCRAMYAMHGKVKGAALLSAIGLPSDAPADISEAQLDFLAFHTGTNASFFSVDRIGEASPSHLSALSRMYGEYPKFSTVEELFLVHRDAIEWESNYKRLCMEAYQKRINMDYFNEIADTLARFRPVEQAKIMALFQAAVEQYEEKTNRKMDAAFAGTAAEKKGNVS